MTDLKRICKANELKGFSKYKTKLDLMNFILKDINSTHEFNVLMDNFEIYDDDFVFIFTWKIKENANLI